MRGFMGLGRKGEVTLECPFCKEGEVRVFHKEGYLQGRTSRISTGAKTKFYKIPDNYEVLGDCPNCGKYKKEIKKALDTGITKELTHEEWLERLRKAGTTTRVEI